MEIKTLNPTQQLPHFSELISLLVAQFKPIHIYQFAQWIHHEETHSIFADTQRQEQVVYYLLVVTDGTASRENEIQVFLDRNFTAAKVILHAHGQEVVQRNLKASNVYFSAVLKHAVLCYQKEGAFSPEEIRMPNPKRWLGKAIVHWRNRSTMAQGFSEAAEHALEYSNERICLYLLYQATEQACVGLIWVFMGYKSDLRNIRRLLYTCGSFSQVPLQHFMGTLENQKLLDVMMKCFSQIRYEDDFSLEGKSIYRFVELVQGFLELADSLCKERFKILESRLPKAICSEKFEEMNDNLPTGILNEQITTI